MQTTLTHEWPELIIKLWAEIEKTLYKEIPDLEKTKINTEDMHALHPATRDNIKKFCNGEIGDFGLYFRIGKKAWFGVEAQHYITIGVKCYREENLEEYGIYYDALNKSGRSPQFWPVYQYEMSQKNFKNQTSEVIAMLLDDKERQNFVSKTVEQATTLWNEINLANLVGFKK